MSKKIAIPGGGAASWIALLFSLTLTACTQSSARQEDPESRTVFVHLFEWTWPEIARECETFLGPLGYAAVQISPPQEHVTGAQWWTRYQPVSYQLESRGGTRVQFEDMVQRCRTAGVNVYADAVINHMSGVGEGVGVAGSEYGLYEYPVPYRYDDFHHCGRHGDDDIRDYQDAWEVRNCELAELADLDTGDDSVRGKIAIYLGDLLELGVAGFRIDAAKHMEPGDIAAILDRLSVQPFVFQEVIDRGNEPIKGNDYVGNGHVTEFKYGMELMVAFTGRDLSGLESLGSGKGFVPPELAVVFVDMHDSQRGHGGASNVLTHKNWNEYELANIFMLAWPYGYPKVMSSYRFSDSDQGPPQTPPVGDQGSCGHDWVCEHRNPVITAMVGFRNATHGQPMTDWIQMSPAAVAFSRGDRGFVAINAGTSTVNARVSVGLAPGSYRDILRGTKGAEDDYDNLIVGEDQTVVISVPPMSAIATHAGAVK